MYREAIRLQCFTPTRYVKNGEYPSCTSILRWRPLPDLLKSDYACLTWLFHACSYTVGHVVTLQSYPQALFLAQQWCTLKSLLFSVQHCWAGNRDLDLGIYYATVSGCSKKNPSVELRFYMRRREDDTTYCLALYCELTLTNVWLFFSTAVSRSQTHTARLLVYLPRSTVANVGVVTTVKPTFH